MPASVAGVGESAAAGWESGGAGAGDASEAMEPVTVSAEGAVAGEVRSTSATGAESAGSRGVLWSSAGVEAGPAEAEI